MPILVHFQAAQPNLNDFTASLATHREAAVTLRESGYDKWVAIEMLEQPLNPPEAVEVAIRAVAAIYEIAGLSPVNEGG